MIIPWTLQRYIFREMGKTFLLTAAGLTVTLSLGGGLLRMIEFGEVTPGQLLRIMALVIPVAAALTLPIAALFSAAATYGRLAADNEFVACRSGGINLHVLFLPTVVLSLVSAGVTFGFTNFLIPGIVQNLDEFIASDVGSLIRQRLARPQGLTLGGGYRIHADGCVADPAQPDHVTLQRVMFVEVKDEEWVRYGSAREVHVNLDRSASPIRLSARMSGVSFYDRKDSQFVDVEEQIIAPSEIQAMVPLVVRYLDLPGLLYYRDHIDEWHQVARTLRDLRLQIGRRAVLDDIEADLKDDKVLTLRDDRFECTILADGPPARIARDGGIELGFTTIEEKRDNRVRTARAERVIIEVSRGDDLDASTIAVQAYNAKLTLENRTLDRAKESFGPLAIPKDLRERLAAMSIDDLVSVATTASERDPIAEKRDLAVRVRGECLRRIAATLNERTAFSASVFVLVILAAALGIVFRGSQTVVAFGIAFIPSLFVIISIVMGKQMANNATTHVAGLGVMWLGILAAAGLDLWTLTRVLRR